MSAAATACTGIAAKWCPTHGDCTCPVNEDGEICWHYEGGYVSVHGFRAWSDTAKSVVDHDPDCPLHSERSWHGL